jgi:hypothetical protein
MKIIINILLFLLSFNLFAKVERITIEPKNRVNVFFNKIPKYESELSSDKKNITITLTENEFNPNFSQVSGSGIVRYVTINKNANNIKLNIELSTERGYVAIPMDYSNSLFIEAFSWNDISADEEKYREALLAFESGLIDETKNLLTSIKSQTIPNANAILGLILMKEGRANDAAPLLFSALKDSSNIIDIYAGLAELFKWIGNDDEFLKNDSIFKEKSKLSSYPSFALSGIKEDIVVPDYYFTEEKEESLLSDSNIDKKQTSGTFLQEYEHKTISELFGFSDSYIIFIVIILLLSFAMLLFVYSKWKKSKIIQYKDMSKDRFSEEIRQARKKQQAKTEEVKEKIIPKNDKSQNLLEKKYGQQKPSSKKMDNIQQFKVRPTKNVKEFTNKEQLEKFLTNYIPVKRQEEVEKKEQQIEEASIYDAEISGGNSNLSPDVNLALKLSEEKQKLKKKQLLELADDVKSKQEKEIIEKAKELGLEKGSIEEKLHINEIENDKEMLAKLNKKFNVDKSKKGDAEDE